MLRPRGRAMGLVLLAPGLILALVIGLLGAAVVGARSTRFEVSPDGLRLRGDLYGRLIPAEQLRAASVMRVDFSATPDLAPAWRTMGTGLPGWFRLKNGEKALLYLTDTNRAVYVPTTAGYSVLVSPEQPDRVRGCRASHHRDATAVNASWQARPPMPRRASLEQRARRSPAPGREGRSAPPGTVPADPVDKGVLRHAPVGQRQDPGDNLGIRGAELPVIDPEERDHRQKAGALVAVPVRVVPHQAECIRRRQQRYLRAVRVVPLLPRAGERRLENVFVVDSRQPAMFAELVGVDGINRQAAEPPGLGPAFRHGLFRQFPEGVAILLCGPCGHFQGAFRVRVVRREEDPAVGLDGEHPVSGLEPQAIRHVLGKGGAHRAPGLAQGHFLGHAPMVAY